MMKGCVSNFVAGFLIILFMTTAMKNVQAASEKSPAQFLERGINSTWFRTVFSLGSSNIGLDYFDLSIIKEAGFDHVRLHLHFEGFGYEY